VNAQLNVATGALFAIAACGGRPSLSDAARDDAHAIDAAVAIDGAAIDALPDGSPDAGLTPCTKPGNQALAFAGSQWVQIADATSLHPTDLTIEAWAKFAGFAGADQVVVAKPLGAQTGDSFALWYEAGKINAGVNPTSVGDAIGYAFAPAVGTWYHLTFTYDHVSSEQKLYVDGALVATGTTTSAPIYDTQAVIIGGDLDFGNPAGFFQGEIDEVKIWDSVRALAEVGLDVHSCTPGSFTGLRAYWALDEAGGQTTADLSGNGNAGTLGDGAGSDARDPSWIVSTVPF
jgi:hypothetical protein